MFDKLQERSVRRGCPPDSNDPPPPYTSQQEEPRAHAATPLFGGRTQQRKSTRLNSTPKEQFLAQAEEEHSGIGMCGADGRDKGTPNPPSFPRRIIQDRWVKQGIWDPKWNGLLHGNDVDASHWKHEEPVHYESESEVDTDAERNPRLFSFARNKSGTSRPMRLKKQPELQRIRERRAALDRDREPSRPFNQFIYQITKERERIQREFPNTKAEDPYIHTSAYTIVNGRWRMRGIWDEKWGVIPGMTWKHERPEEQPRQNGMFVTPYAVSDRPTQPTNRTQQAMTQTGSLFGNHSITPSQTGTTTSSLFGASQPKPSPTLYFGGKPTDGLGNQSTGEFGNQSTPSFGGGLFGTSPQPRNNNVSISPGNHSLTPSQSGVGSGGPFTPPSGNNQPNPHFNRSSAQKQVHFASEIESADTPQETKSAAQASGSRRTRTEADRQQAKELIERIFDDYSLSRTQARSITNDNHTGESVNSALSDNLAHPGSNYPKADASTGPLAEPVGQQASQTTEPGEEAQSEDNESSESEDELPNSPSSSGSPSPRAAASQAKNRQTRSRASDPLKPIHSSRISKTPGKRQQTPKRRELKVPREKPSDDSSSATQMVTPKSSPQPNSTTHEGEQGQSHNSDEAHNSTPKSKEKKKSRSRSKNVSGNVPPEKPQGISKKGNTRNGRGKSKKYLNILR